MNKIAVLILPFLSLQTYVNSCSDILVTPDASEDGSAMIAYNADSGGMVGVLYHYPATENAGGTTRKIFDWDSGKFLGEIPEVPTTYNVVGNTNEYGLCIGESTFGGVPVLAHQDGAIIDYGSLIYITLQRTKTALDAIKFMVSLLDEYGYASEGESFSIADRSGDVWIMEVIGRGSDYHRKLGAVWVARKVPDGYVTAHANQARITTFPRDDPDNCLFADDVVEVAIHYGLFPEEADPSDFSFSDVYNPVSFSGARLSDARVWSIFSLFADDDKSFQQEYLDYATGRDLSHRMPLWIEPYKKLSVKDLIDAMANHYEGTELDASIDVGGALYKSPYRPRPLIWKHEGKEYHNERSVGTQQTGWSFIAQMRPWMPREMSALVWFAVDDSATSPRVPFWGGCTQVGSAYGGKGTQDGVPNPIFDFDMNKAFWIQNMVANFAYPRWDAVSPLLKAEIADLYHTMSKSVVTVEGLANKKYKEGKEGKEEAVSLLTKFHQEASDVVQQRWQRLYGELFARFRDFFEIVPKEGEESCGCQVMETGLSDEMKERIIKETGNHYATVLDENMGSHSHIMPSSSLK